MLDSQPAFKLALGCGIVMLGDTHLCSRIPRAQPTRVRLGGAAGTHLDGSFCPKSGAGGYDNCSAAFLGIHLTPLSSAYLEVSPQVYFVSGCWLNGRIQGHVGVALRSRP